MNKRVTAIKAEKAQALLVKRDRGSPAISIAAGNTVVIKAGTIFATRTFKKDTILAPPAAGYVAGNDYTVRVMRGVAVVEPFAGGKVSPSVLGGFHYAPGGNAIGTEGGGDVPAINPHSVWDRNFRPACPDPRGMTLVELGGRRFWCDIYLLGTKHLSAGTSRFAANIADGKSLPEPPPGATFARFDYEAAVAVMEHHGKGLLGADEFFAAAYGVKERSAADGDPVVTQLDALRTSRRGVIQATGNLWVWGHDGHPDDPRASLFGGSWFLGRNAGSRYAFLDYWPGDSGGTLGARGRSDHLQLD